MISQAHINHWRAKADQLKPVLQIWPVDPVGSVRLITRTDAWQHTDTEKVTPQALYQSGEQLIFDFGEHLTGRIELTLSIPNGDCDSPIHLRLLAAELPYELQYRRENYRGALSSAWIQEEQLKFDLPPQQYTFDHRFALRYLLIEILATPQPIHFDHIRIHAESAAGQTLPEAPAALPEKFRAIDRIGLRTLRNCMQDFFEDGPKRDRRLWLGDLRLQAMVNAVSYRDFDLVERSLYLLAAGIDTNGVLPGCAYAHPFYGRGCDVNDYALLFAPTLRDHLYWSHRREVVEELYELAKLQFEHIKKQFDHQHLFHAPPIGWIFIDHCSELEKETAFTCISIYGLHALAELADALEKPEDAREARQLAQIRTLALRQHRLDPETGLFFSGSTRQISYASQIWAIIAGVVSPHEGRILLQSLRNTPTAIQPVTPYLQHHLLEAYHICQEESHLLDLIHNYWGAMVNSGASTFWEVFKPGDDFFSPYDDAMINSACHAWSCTPSYYLRK